MGSDRAGDADRRSPTHTVVVLGRPLQAKAIGALARTFGDVGVNIETITRIADYPVTGLELTVTAPDDEQLRSVVAAVAATAGVDIAVQRAALARRAKRLVVCDGDYTLITAEVCAMLADRPRTRAKALAITPTPLRG